VLVFVLIMFYVLIEYIIVLLMLPISVTCITLM